MTPRFIADENVDPDLLEGLRRRVEDIDILRVQDIGLRTADDPAILQWAAEQGRILVSHDIKTMPGFAAARLRAGLPMPGLILLRATLAIALAVEELAAVAGASEAEEWNNQIAYLPRIS